MALFSASLIYQSRKITTSQREWEHELINADQRQYVVDPWPMIYAISDESDTINMYLEALNLPELVSIRQQQYDRYLKALNN